jgi:pimeloyl-ACP methyl ester carboxylesterase
VLAHVRELDPYVAASTLESLAEAKLGGKFSYPIPVLAVYAQAEAAGVKDWLAEHFPNNRLLVWDDVDHYPQLERPARLSGEMVKFLGK